jgi:hypothetical protein
MVVVAVVGLRGRWANSMKTGCPSMMLLSARRTKAARRPGLEKGVAARPLKEVKAPRRGSRVPLTSM